MVVSHVMLRAVATSLGLISREAATLSA